jgi:hypothetical protein
LRRRARRAVAGLRPVKATEQEASPLGLNGGNPRDTQLVL